MDYLAEDIQPHLLGEAFPYLPWNCPQTHGEGAQIAFEGFHFKDNESQYLTAWGRCPYCGTVGEIPQLRKRVIGPEAYDLDDPRLRNSVLGDDIVERRTKEDLRRL